MKKFRIYVDTSVFGGCFDDEFEGASKLLFRVFEKKEAIPVVSSIVYSEIMKAPEQVRALFYSLKEPEVAELNNEIRRLANLYLAEEIITKKYLDDATHIAIATYHQVDVLVSWNFKHIVNLRKIHQFNTVNYREGYSILEIRNPREVVDIND